MSKIKLLLTDLDNTILLNHSYVSQNTKLALQKLVEDKVEVVFATGRIYQSIPDFFLQFPNINYIVSSNGAKVFDMKNKEIIFHQTLDNNIAIEVLNSIKTLPRHYQIIVDGQIVSEKRFFNSNSIIDNPFLQYIKDKSTLVDNLVEYIKESSPNIVKLDISFNEDDLDYRNELYEYFLAKNHFTTTSSYPRNIEISGLNSTKGSAMQFLKDKLNLNGEHSFAIGDNDNDISMIKVANIGVAMENGTDRLKQSAKYITDTIENDGFSKAINKFFNYNINTDKVKLEKIR